MTKDKNNQKDNIKIIIRKKREHFTRKIPINIRDNVKGSTDTTNSTGPGKTDNDKKESNET